MKTITLYEPWASWIAAGCKTIEAIEAESLKKLIVKGKRDEAIAAIDGCDAGVLLAAIRQEHVDGTIKLAKWRAAAIVAQIEKLEAAKGAES